MLLGGDLDRPPGISRGAIPTGMVLGAQQRWQRTPRDRQPPWWSPSPSASGGSWPEVSTAACARGPVVGRPHLRRAFRCTGVSWYLGPATVMLAILGLALATCRPAAPHRPPVGDVLALMVVPSMRSIFGSRASRRSHIWAMRRYVPAILPGMIAFAVIAAAWILGLPVVRGLPTIGRAVVVVAAVLALALPPIAATWPVRDVQQRRGYLVGLDRACELLGDDVAVLVFAGGCGPRA